MLRTRMTTLAGCVGDIYLFFFSKETFLVALNVIVFYETLQASARLKNAIQ